MCKSRNVDFNTLYDCNLCPRNCYVNRLDDAAGYCRTGKSFYISTICAHRGEEPVISGKNGICNVFFSHCNLQCIYCQNNQISSNKSGDKHIMPFDEAVNQICYLLKTGCHALGFVSPSHQIPQMLALIEAVNKKGYEPVIVYNSGGYDKVEVLRKLENIVDVYLPDLKYLDNKIAGEYSKAEDYPQVAKNALKEMYRQKGDKLHVNSSGEAEKGLIIRHLVIPHKPQLSISVLRFIAYELSPLVAVSLMSQYFPTYSVARHKTLKDIVSPADYKRVTDTLEELGFCNGWVQGMDSFDNYKPDFNRKHPFE